MPSAPGRLSPSADPKPRGSVLHPAQPQPELPARQALLRHVAGTRALLAFSAGLMLLPAAPDRLAALVLLAYSVGATALLWLSLRGWPQADWRLWPWLDALVLLLASRLLSQQVTALAALTVLPVVALALLWGLRASATLAAACAACLGLLAGADAQGVTGLVVPLVLLALGPAVALLQRPGAALRQRRRLLEDFNAQADPRHGLQHQVQVLLGLLGTHFGLQRAVLDLPGPQPRVFCRGVEGEAVQVLQGPALQAWRAQCEALPPGFGVLAGAAPAPWLRALEPASGAPGPALPPQACRALQGAGAQVLWMPLRSYGRAGGHLCLVRHEPAFSAAELRALHALLHELLPLLERTDLLEQLQQETTARERERIGRDLHDSAVQPYLGLKYGLEALARMAGAHNPLGPPIAELVRMTNAELQTLRDTVSGLRRGQDPRAGDTPLAALQRQAQRFESLYGLKVEVQPPAQAPQLHGSLAKALLHLFNEALTNVRRHTQATTVAVSFDVQPGSLCMRVRNDRPDGTVPPPFTPRSLSERAHELGGAVTVSLPPGGTEVAVTLPLTGTPA